MAPKHDDTTTEEPKHNTEHNKETSTDSEPTSSPSATPTDSSTAEATTTKPAETKAHSTAVSTTPSTFSTASITSTTASSLSATAASQTIASTSTPTGANFGSSSHTAAIAGIVVFGVFAALAVSCLAGFFLKRRRDNKKVAAFAKRPSYNPFRSSSYSSTAHIPLTSDPYHGNTTYSSHGAAAQTPDDDKASMFSRTRSASTLSVYTVVPNETHHEDEYSTRRLSSSLVPVAIAQNDNHGYTDQSYSDRGRSREALSPDDAPRPNISVTRPSVEEWQIGIPQVAPSASVVSPISPTDARTGRERSRSSVSLNRFYDPGAVARAM